VVVPGLPDRHGNHLLAGPVQRLQRPESDAAHPHHAHPFWWTNGGPSPVQHDHYYGLGDEAEGAQMLESFNRQSEATREPLFPACTGRCVQRKATGWPRPPHGEGPARVQRSAQGPVADQDPASSSVSAPRRTRASTAPALGWPTPATIRRTGDATARVTHQHGRAQRVAGQHDLARADPPGPADQQPVKGTSTGSMERSATAIRTRGECTGIQWARPGGVVSEQVPSDKTLRKVIDEAAWPACFERRHSPTRTAICRAAFTTPRQARIRGRVRKGHRRETSRTRDHEFRAAH